jgi:hypothetical protein
VCQNPGAKKTQLKEEETAMYLPALFIYAKVAKHMFQRPVPMGILFVPLSLPPSLSLPSLQCDLRRNYKTGEYAGAISLAYTLRNQSTNIL